MFTRSLQPFKKAARVSWRMRRNFVTLPCLGFVSNFDCKLLVINSVRVAVFTSKDEVGEEAVLGGFNRD